MTPPRRFAPVWLMGLTNATFGLYGGIVAIAVPELLSNQHVPESTIAGMTAVMISPGFWTFLVSPVLDVRFSRRWYCVVTAAAAAIFLVVGMMNLDHLAVLEGSLVLGFFAANLNQSALGGWLSTITSTEEESQLSVWVTIGNIGGGGAMAVLCGELVRNLPLPVAALLLGATVMLPSTVFPLMQAPGPDRRLASESFSQFFGEIVNLLRRREVLIAIVLLVAPAGTFSLTNFLGGLGGDYHASPHFVGVIAGGGVFLGGIAGCLAFPFVSRLLPLRPLYLAIAAVGSIFTFSLIVLPRTPAIFALAFIGENVFQSLAITNGIAIAFETIGRKNPLAATTYCLIVSAFNIPITYMLTVDGAGYSHHGLAGSYAADAGTGIAATLLLGLMLLWLGRNSGLRLEAEETAPVA
jgi:MFS transporter, PAT family, beta-lactamase induction signal transducer AmpG